MFKICYVFLLAILGSFAMKNQNKCEDDLDKDCVTRVQRGECHGGYGGSNPYTEARRALAECRGSCRRHYAHLQGDQLPDLIKLFGGLEDYVVDLFGFKLDLCNPSNLFTSRARLDVLFHIGSYNNTAEWVPKITDVGIEKTKIPEQLYGKIVKEYNELKHSEMRFEYCKPSVINCQRIYEEDDQCHITQNTKIYMMQLSSELLEELKEELTTLAEKWSKLRLKHTSTYGIRRYTNGSWVISHVDRFQDDVVSAIMNIGQSVTNDWDLHLLDNGGQHHAIILQPGDMVWYESARLLHGRPDQFNGEYFDNLFIHFKPSDLWYNHEVELGEDPRESKITLDEVKRAQSCQSYG